MATDKQDLNKEEKSGSRLIFYGALSRGFRFDSMRPRFKFASLFLDRFLVVEAFRSHAKNAPVVQWIEHRSPEPKIWVRLPAGVPEFVFGTVVGALVDRGGPSGTSNLVLC